jgi:ADP-ribosylglycohydrolase/ankyrin repeat protein
MNALFDRIYGALIGSAIGDAMGGPVEGLHFTEIAEKYGRVESLLPYTEVIPSYHGPFDTQAGAYTDDTRLALIFSQAVIHAGGLPKKGDIAHALADYYFNAETEMERGFIEEYYLKGVYGDPKEVFGGRPTNGGIMGIAPFGAIFPCDPDEAFLQTFQNLFISTGSARSASAFAAAMIAAAMKPGADWESVMKDAFSADSEYKKTVEATAWRNSNLYPVVAVKTEDMARQAMNLGIQAESVYSFNQELYEAVVQPFFADGSESLAIAVAMFSAAKGDFVLTVQGCVNFGRDNDSSAAVGGAVAGALCGAANIPQEWVTMVEHANPPLTAASLPTLQKIAEVLTGLTMRRNNLTRKAQKSRDFLLYGIHKNEKIDFTLPELAASQNSELFAALAGGMDPDQSDESGKTALHLACASGWTEAVSLLLMYGADPNARDKNATTPLHFAAWLNHLDCIQLLFNYGVDPDLAEGKGWTALHDGVRREYSAIILEILKGSRNVRTIKDAGVKIGSLEGDERFLAILKLLAVNQVALNSVGICGQSLLHDAVERGYVKSVKILVEQGADVNQLAFSFSTTRFEGTPLHKAAAYAHKEIYELLTAAGADEKIKNIDGKTPQELWGTKGELKS